MNKPHLPYWRKREKMTWAKFLIVSSSHNCVQPLKSILVTYREVKTQWYLVFSSNLLPVSLRSHLRHCLPLHAQTHLSVLSCSWALLCWHIHDFICWVRSPWLRALFYLHLFSVLQLSQGSAQWWHSSKAASGFLRHKLVTCTSSFSVFCWPIKSPRQPRFQENNKGIGFLYYIK